MQLSKVKFTYAQESDSCQSSDEAQEITISTDNAGGGNFIILKTARWALGADEIDAFCQKLKDTLNAT